MHACWDCGFESCLGPGCLFVVIVVCCQVEVCALGSSVVRGMCIGQFCCQVKVCASGSSVVR